MCLLFRQKTVHCSTKNAYTCEITFLAFVPWVQPWKYKCNESSWNYKLLFNSGFVYIWKIPLKPGLIPSTRSRSAFEFSSRVNLSGPSLTVPSSMDRTSRCNKVDAVPLNASYRLNLLLLKGQICVIYVIIIIITTVYKYLKQVLGNFKIFCLGFLCLNYC